MSAGRSSSKDSACFCLTRGTKPLIIDKRYGPVAHLGERCIRIAEVVSSSLIRSTMNSPTIIWLWGFVLIWRLGGNRYCYLSSVRFVGWTTFALHHPRGSRGEPHSISFLLHRRLRFSVQRLPTVLHHLLPPQGDSGKAGQALIRAVPALLYLKPHSARILSRF